MEALLTALSFPARLLPTTMFALTAGLVLSLLNPGEVASFAVILVFCVGLSADVTILALHLVRSRR